MEKVGGADAGLVYRQRQRALLAQPPHEMHLIRRKRLLQDADACISEAPSDGRRLVWPQALVGIRPHEGIGTGSQSDCPGYGDIGC
jgi:hypothetical protein